MRRNGGPSETAKVHSWILARISESLKRKYSYELPLLAIARMKRKSVTHIVSQLDRVASPAWEEDTVASLDRRRHNISLLIGRTGSNGDDGSLWERRTGGRGGEEDTRRSFLQVDMSISFDEMRDEVRTVSGLKRCTRTRSNSGTTALIDLKVIWEAYSTLSTRILASASDTHHCDVVEEQRNFSQPKFASVCSKKSCFENKSSPHKLYSPVSHIPPSS